MEENSFKSNLSTRLQEVATDLRADVLRMLSHSASGHTGGSLSIIDILAVLYFSKMNHNPKKPDWEGRDRFVLSKGHGAPALYAALSKVGYFQKDDLLTLRKMGSSLSGHPLSLYTKGVDVSTGSLGQGLSQANGLALALRLNKNPARVYVVMGDGEIQEGQVWEAAMTAAHYKVDNLCAVIDNNNLQIDGKVSDVMSVYPIGYV